MGKSKPSADYLGTLRRRYAAASKKERGVILDELVKTSGYHRKHASALLRGRRLHRQGPIRRPRARVYTDEDKRAVLKLAAWFDEINSKRLRVAMDNTLSDLRRQGHLRVSADSYRRLRRISASTIGRIRRAVRLPGSRRKGFTKPGTLLKRQIPIRTFSAWDDTRAGFVEVDLVDHSGGDSKGDFAQTLNVTDVHTAWTEMRAVPTKAQRFVFDALKTIRGRLPVPLLGIDSDNGAEFINNQLYRYCQTEQITFTRGRSGRKNDNPFVEQKNWSVVRRLVGYRRFHTRRHVDLLNQLYGRYRLYVNFFLPVMKLKEKVRIGSRVKKVYEKPQTPYARVLACAEISQAAKRRLTAQYARLDVVQLKAEIETLLDALLTPRVG